MNGEKEHTIEWIWRGVSMLFSLAIFTAVVWMRGEFVSKVDYQSDQKEQRQLMTAIATTITKMEAGAEVDQRQNTQLADLEHRLRALERMTP